MGKTKFNKNPNRLNLIPIEGLNKKQTQVLNCNNNLVLQGCPGTGKTFLAMYIALKLLFTEKEVEKVIITRSAVSTRNLGYMPGTLADKLNIYEDPYRDICSLLFGREDAYDNLKNKGQIQFISTSNIRGKTLRNCVLIVDEFSNLTYHELRSVITRVSNIPKVIFSGDVGQTDISNNGVNRFNKVLKLMAKYPFSIFDFTPDEIVRSGLVKEFIEKEYESCNK